MDNFIDFTFVAIPKLKELLEIGILWAVIYYLLKLIRGTRGAQVLSGLIFFILLVLMTTQILNFYTLNWIFKQFSVYIVVAFIVIFQPEIRRALAELATPASFSQAQTKINIAEQVADAVETLAAGKIGALIAIERTVGTRPIQMTGVQLDCLVTPELLATLFYPRTPLHDGGVIIREDRVVAAGCVFPLTQRDELSRSLGTRHRAAIGITEETDAVVVVVSEETGNISLAYRGRLSRGLDRERLVRLLTSMLKRTKGTADAAAPFQTSSGDTPVVGGGSHA